MVGQVHVRYPVPNGTSRKAAGRFADQALRALNDRADATELRLDLTAMRDPGRAWIDELLNRRLLPHCRQRGIGVTVLVSTDFAAEQLTTTVYATPEPVLDLRLVRSNRSESRPRGASRGDRGTRQR